MTSACTTSAETKETLAYQVFVIEAMVHVFEECLDPAEVIHLINFTEDQMEKLIGKDRPEAAKLLLKEVLSKPEEHVSLFVAALRHIEFDHFINILDDKPMNKDMQHAAEKYKLLVRMLEGELIKKIIPSDIVDDLEPILGAGDREKILAIEDKTGPIPACQELFLCMKRKTPNWPLRFLEVLYANMPRLPAKMDPSLENGAASIVSASDRTATDTVDTAETVVKEICTADTRSDLSEESEEDDYRTALSDEEKQDYEDLEKDLLSPTIGRCPNLNMRKYQLELAEKATERQNTIVYAPTGSGKTRVAIYIAKHILENTDDADGRKVFFLEPTIALVDQTYNAVNHYLGKIFKVAKVRGRDEQSISLHALLPVNDVIVMTPKILDNHLENGRIKSVSGMCRLLILDECHHTRKEEVYNKVMLRYLKEKKSGANDLPQILGLTATLGVEKALTTENAITNILKLCANLDSVIVPVVKYVEELKRLVAVPDEETISIRENHDSPSRKAIESAMTRVEGYLTQFHVLGDEAVNRLTARARDQMDQSSQIYNQWTVFLKEAAARVDAKDDSARQELIHNLYVVADHLYIYNVALTLEDTVRVKDVLAYLKRELVSGDGGTACESQLQDIAKGVMEALLDHEEKRKENRKHENPKLIQLANILQTILENDDGDTRVIIFARTRTMCAALAKWLNEDEHLPQALKDLRADVFTGLQASGQDGGMTQSEQDSVIAKFRKGAIKLIVATSVAHEGLDIPECNIVISYNHVGNEITTMQTRGRSRKVGGKSFLLASDKVQQKQEQNIFKVHKMKQAISMIRQIPRSEFDKRIAEFQTEALACAEVKEQNQRQNTLEMKDVEFTLLCKKGREVCTDRSMLRLINNTHRVSIDKEVRDTKINVTESPTPDHFKGVSIDGKISCKECGKPWGSWITYRGVHYPSLSIKNFSLKSTDAEKPQTFKQWTKCPYVIKPLTAEDTLTYLRSDEEKARSDDEEFDLC